MIELIIMTEEMKKKLDPDAYSAYSCVIDKSANVIIWQGYVHWTERERWDFIMNVFILQKIIKRLLFYLIL